MGVEFVNLNMNDIMYNLEACISSGSKKRRVAVWSPPITGILKLNFDGAIRGKLAPAGIGWGFFATIKGRCRACFLKVWGLDILRGRSAGYFGSVESFLSILPWEVDSGKRFL